MHDTIIPIDNPYGYGGKVQKEPNWTFLGIDQVVFIRKVKW